MKKNAVPETDNGKRTSAGRKILRGVLIVIGALVLCAALFLGVMTVLEYRPAEAEEVAAAGGEETLKAGDTFSLLSYNIGYAALSSGEDFFMDGGKKVMPDDKSLVEENIAGIADTLKEQDTDILFLQEVDLDSKRSFGINEKAYLEEALGKTGMFAYNFKAALVPYPIPMIGRVNSGLVTFSDFAVAEASRISLPCPFSWPIRTCNLKRCILETRVPVGEEGKELVLLNFHLEAYDSGEGKIAQSRKLEQIMAEEREKGNYVIAGGDFNQTFEEVEGTYPIRPDAGWVPGKIGSGDLPEGFSFAVSDNVPTCRLLDGPYSGNYTDSQVYVIDGFVISDNLELVSVENIDTGFAHADHQPVRLEVKLQ